MQQFIDRQVELRNRAWEEAKSLLDHAASEARDLSGEEQAQYDRIVADIDRYDESINRFLGLDGGNLDAGLDGTRLALRVLTETVDGLVVTVNVSDDAVVLRLLLTRKVTGLRSGVVEKALGLLPRTVAQLNLTVDVLLHVSPP